MRQQTLVVMLKVPRVGRVKTRLGKDIGMVTAAWWFRQQVTHLLRSVDDPRWTVVLAVAPDREGLTSRAWTAEFARIPQGRGDLGARMRRALMHFQGPTILIGGDIPGINADHIARAFRALGHAPAVLGPAPDGGFWLIGLKHSQRSPASMFRGVRWSVSDTMAQTIPTLPGSVAFTDELADVDTAADLRTAGQSNGDGGKDAC